MAWTDLTLITKSRKMVYDYINKLIGNVNWLKANGGGSGSGDMTKAIYDANDDGIVNASASVDDGIAGHASTAEEIAASIDISHSHSNKSVLDTISSAPELVSNKRTAWGGGATVWTVDDSDTAVNGYAGEDWLEDAAKAWTANAWIGKYVRIEGEAPILITGNDATNLWFSGNTHPEGNVAFEIGHYAVGTGDDSHYPSEKLVQDALNLKDSSNYSTTSQAITAATRTYIAGSAISLPTAKLKIGTILKWVIHITKTAAGTAASTYDICFGTTGTVTDTARVSFAKPAGTAVADVGRIEIMAIIRAKSSTGIVAGLFHLVHNLNATGHATIANVVRQVTSAAFDLTVENLIAGICITSGAADAITIELCQAEALNLN